MQMSHYQYKECKEGCGCGRAVGRTHLVAEVQGMSRIRLQDLGISIISRF